MTHAHPFDIDTTIEYADEGVLRYALETAMIFRLSRKDRTTYSTLDTVLLEGKAGAETLYVWSTDRIRIVRVEVPLNAPLTEDIRVPILMDGVTLMIKSLGKHGGVGNLRFKAGTGAVTLDTYATQTTVMLSLTGEYPQVSRILINAGTPGPEGVRVTSMAAETMAKLGKVKPYPREDGSTLSPGSSSGDMTIWWGDGAKPALWTVGESRRVFGAVMPMRPTPDRPTVPE